MEAPSNVQSTSTSLIERLRSNSPDAWRRIVDLYEPVVYRWCRRVGLSNEDARDIAQQVFQGLAKHMDGFRRDRPGDSFRGWLWTIARNKVRDHFRRWKDEPHAIGGSDVQKRMAELPDLSEDLSSISSDEDDRRILLQELMNALRQEIEKRTWTAFWRTTIDGHSSADVARDLGMSTKAVRQAKYRVLQRIRMELEGLEDMFVG